MDAGHVGIPHVERFIQRRIEHQRDRQKNGRNRGTIRKYLLSQEPLKPQTGSKARKTKGSKTRNLLLV